MTDFSPGQLATLARFTDGSEMHRAMLQIFTAENIARSRPNHPTPTRVVAGYYFYYDGSILWEITRNPEFEGREKWIAYDTNNQHTTHTDPYETLAQVMHVLKS